MKRKSSATATSSNGSLNAWLLAALMAACVRFAEPLGQILSISSIYSMVQQGYARLREHLAIAPLPRVGTADAPARHDITFDNVHYHYDVNPEPVLRGVSLHIPERALTALVGHSGCGKTTLVRLIMRYADPQQGRVLIGGSDICALTQAELMRQISVVFQDVYLFDDTIANNIRLGKAAPATPKSKPPPAPRAATTSSWRCRTATRPASATSVANSPAAKNSASASPAPC